jgi:ribosomal protein S18 acetylase RimI-like enzyme
MTTNEGDRLHSGLIKSFVATMPRVDGAWIEQRTGYVVASCPAIPLPGFNGLWIDGDVPRDRLSVAIEQLDAAGAPCWLLVRAGTTGPFDATAAALGFHLEDTVPGMALAREALVGGPAVGAEVLRLDLDHLDATIEISAASFEGPRPIFEAMYASIAATRGFAVYEARAEGTAVSTACSWLVDRAVGIFNVATPAEHRRRGYGRAVTERAIRDAFEAGADLAWLQASELGTSVYRAMGFRQVEAYHVYARLHPPAG